MVPSLARGALVFVLALAVAIVGAGCAAPAPSASSSPVATATPSLAPSGASSAVATVGPGASPITAGFRLSLEPIVSGLASPLDVALRPGEPGAMYVVEQAGRIRVVRDATLAPTPVLDIAGIVTAGDEQGLLGLAFHPDPADGRLFVYYTALDGQQVVASYRTDPSAPDRALPDSERILLRMADPYANHNGGGLAFGPDGYLYISTGDGGAAGDPLGSGRHLDTLLAKVLRIDVDAGDPDGVDYGIPKDDPFVETAGARPEIWATGLRNPWRIRFDRATGDLWIGDVGQDSWEEIDRVPAGMGGLDFGWNRMEGTHCYSDGCDDPSFTAPVTEYGHDQGCSVIGGTVVRGDAQPALTGWYVFADYCTGRFWVIDAAAAAKAPQAPLLVLDSGRNISAIAEDGRGGVVATDLGSGELLRVIATAD